MRRRTVLGVDADVAETFCERVRGLIGRPPPAPGRGMLITRCNCIHTFFMAYPIDVVFVDRNGRALKTVRNVRPWRPMVWGGWRAVAALETTFARDERADMV